MVKEVAPVMFVLRIQLKQTRFPSSTCVCACPGEIFELKAELNSDKKEKKKEAVKKVIASMTVGKDVR